MALGLVLFRSLNRARRTSAPHAALFPVAITSAAMLSVAMVSAAMLSVAMVSAALAHSLVPFLLCELGGHPLLDRRDRFGVQL